MSDVVISSNQSVKIDRFEINQLYSGTGSITIYDSLDSEQIEIYSIFIQNSSGASTSDLRLEYNIGTQQSLLATTGTAIGNYNAIKSQDAYAVPPNTRIYIQLSISSNVEVKILGSKYINSP